MMAEKSYYVCRNEVWFISVWRHNEVEDMAVLTSQVRLKMERRI